jgi:hypothetical protein
MKKTQASKKLRTRFNFILSTFGAGLIAAAIFVILLSLPGAAGAASLSEGLWKELVDNDTAAAALIYQKIISETGAAADEGAIKKARKRLEALGAGGNETIKQSPAVNFAVLKIDFTRILSQLRSKINNKQDIINFDDLIINIKAELSKFIKEDLEKHSLPLVYIITRTGALNIADTDIILCFNKDVTFKNDENSAANKIYGYNINWNTIIISSIASETKIIDFYQKIGFWHDYPGKTDSLEQILLRSSNLTPCYLSFHVNNLAEFIDINKILPAYFKNMPEIKQALILLESDRLLLSTEAGLDDINKLLTAIDSIPGVKILPASIVREQDGSRRVKLTTLNEIQDALIKVLPVINQNYSSARRLAEYKSCMANIRNITGVTELYAMEHEKFKKEDINEKFINELAAQNYLKTLPSCPAGGKYIYKNSEFVCSQHGFNTKTIEFKIVKLINGVQKTISAPVIKTVVYQDASITIGSGKEPGETDGGNKNAENGIEPENNEVISEIIKEKGRKEESKKDDLKFLKITVKLLKDGESALNDQLTASLSFNMILSAGDNKEKTVQFNSTVKLSGKKDGGPYELKIPNDSLNDYKIFIKAY